MKELGKAPEKNTSEWKRNEKLINETPALKAVRDITEGFTPGKGSIGTRVPSQAYKDGWDAIWGKKDTDEE